jgi:hypothetical protein
MNRFQLTDEQKKSMMETGSVPELTPAQIDDRLADNFKLESFNSGLQYFGKRAGMAPCGLSG